MFHSNLHGDWSELVDRLDAAGYPQRWAHGSHLAG
jgi:hypothetical protein